MKFIAACICLVCLATTSINAQAPLLGKWEGGITVPGGSLNIIFNIEGDANNYSGTLDIPQQGARGLRLTTISHVEDSVVLVFSAGAVTGTFRGVLETPNKIEGTYTQGGPTTPFSITRTTEPVDKNDTPSNETDYVIKNGDIEIGGTLTIPEGDAKGPLLILSSGSGAQDRDSNVYDFKIFGIIAQHLASKGIPSFRYDDRGIGKSSGNFSQTTLDDLTSDVNAIVNFFQSNSDYSIQEFAVLGHSQGGLVASKSGAENKAVKQVILMGSTGEDLKSILRFQVKQAYGVGIHPAADVDKEIDLREQIMVAIRDGGDVEKARTNYTEHYTGMLNNLPDQQKSTISNIEQFADRQSRQLVSYYALDQTQSMLFYNPMDSIRELKIPVLVLFGGKDTQVTIAQNEGPIKTALDEAGVAYEIKKFDEANHLFQKANTGFVSEYPLLEKNFIEGFLDTLSDWMLAN